MIFGKDPSHLLTANEFVKVMGMKSGNMLKEFKGHKDTVNDMEIVQNMT